jgi:hypothetical protein
MVTVDFSGQTKEAKADAQGKWQVELAPLPASAELVQNGIYARSVTRSTPP